MDNTISKTSMLTIPIEERPYEKCIANGPSSLSDAELLAVLLRSGSKGENALQLARKLLSLSETYPGIIGLYHLSFQELTVVSGIGDVKALQILCIAELSKRFSKARVYRELSFCNPSSIADYFMEEMRHKEREELHLLMLDCRNKLISDVTISIGTINMAPASPREIFLKAVAGNAVSIILLHNHPSGDASPSADDIGITERILRAGELIGIPLLDHIIIGECRYVSLRECSGISERIWNHGTE